MARDLSDLAVALEVTASVVYGPVDNDTALAPSGVAGRGYGPAGGVEGRRRGLKGLRLGVLDGFFNHMASDETSPVDEAMARAIRKMEAVGASAVNATSAIYDAAQIGSELDVQRFEFRQLLDAYLSSPNLTGPADRLRSFDELYGPGGKGEFLVVPAQYEYVRAASASSTSNATWARRQAGIEDLARSLRGTFAEHALDAVEYPEQNNLVVRIGSPSQPGRNGILAALTGVPVVTVPAGFSPPSPDAPVGVPIGIEILGLPWSEAELLAVARAVGGLLRGVRRMPALTNGTVEVKDYGGIVPTVVPNRGSIPAAHPVGTLG